VRPALRPNSSLNPTAVGFADTRRISSKSRYAADRWRAST